MGDLSSPSIFAYSVQFGRSFSGKFQAEYLCRWVGRPPATRSSACHCWFSIHECTRTQTNEVTTTERICRSLEGRASYY